MIVLLILSIPVILAAILSHTKKTYNPINTTDFYNLTVNNTGGDVIVDRNIIVSNILQMNNGDFDLKDYIVDLGLIYEITYDGEKNIDIEMTFSTPSCPLGDTIVTNIKETIQQKYPDFITNIEIVFDPPWSPELVSEEGKKILGM